MKKILIIACLAAITLLSITIPARADVAPPEPAPGGGIMTTAGTKVQMVSENVLMVVRQKAASNEWYVDVTAEFLMKNQGVTDEELEVRFPMLDITEPWREFVVNHFSAYTNGIKKQTAEKIQSYANGMEMNWSVFDVEFPKGKFVNIKVTYQTDLRVYTDPYLNFKYNQNYSKIRYILGTGAGWYKDIGSATFAIRLPYPANSSNVKYWYIPEKYSQDPVFVKNEFRFEFTNIEPDPKDEISITIVDPPLWINALDLETETGNNPNDIDSIIELSNLYRKIGNEKICVRFPNAAALAEMTIQQALVSHFQDTRLHAQLAALYAWQLNCGGYYANENTLPNLQAEIEKIHELDPGFEFPAEVQNDLDFTMSNIATETAVALVTDTPTPTVLPFLTHVSSSGGQIPVSTKPIPTTIPTQTKTVNPQVTEKEAPLPIPGLILGGFLLAGGFVLGMVVQRGRKKK